MIAWRILFNQSRNREWGRGVGGVVLLPAVGCGEGYIHFQVPIGMVVRGGKR